MCRILVFPELPLPAPLPQTIGFVEFIVKMEPKMIFAPQIPTLKKTPLGPKMEIHCKKPRYI